MLAKKDDELVAFMTLVVPTTSSEVLGLFFGDHMDAAQLSYKCLSKNVSELRHFLETL